jgi:predicted nucleotidyltransferase
MDVPSLCDGLALDGELQKCIAHLVTIKATARESDLIARNPVLDNFIATILQTTATRPADAPGDSTASWEEADGLFRKIVAGL